MDQLKAMGVFVQIAERGSLTAAAHVLGQSPASVVRSLAALERHLGVRLVNRTTRRIALTEEGRDYLTWCNRILSEFDLIEERLETYRTSPSGTVRLTAPIELGSRHLAPLINDYLRTHPTMRIELMLLDRQINLLEEGLDLAVRIGHLPDSSIIAQSVGQTRPVLCASPAFLERVVRPLHPSQLQQMECISFVPNSRRWEFQVEGVTQFHEPVPRLETNQVSAALSACLDGIGIVRLFHYQVAEHLASGRLIRLLPQFEPNNTPIQLVYPHRLLLPPRVRHFLTWITPRLEARLPAPDAVCGS